MKPSEEDKTKSLFRDKINRDESLNRPETLKNTQVLLIMIH